MLEYAPTEPSLEERPWWMPTDGLDRLIKTLAADGMRVIGPQVQDGVIVHADISSVADLPLGVTDEQAPARYRTLSPGTPVNGARARHFDYAASPTSWKPFTFPATVPISSARRVDGKLELAEVPRDVRPMAFIGVRACDVAAIRIQDRVLMEGPFIDEDYRDRRAAAFIVAVECARPSSTCFCTSMGTGPEVTDGYDLALTELDEGFLVRAGSDRARDIVERLDVVPAEPAHLAATEAIHAAARAAMGVPMEMDGVGARLIEAREHPRWAEVAERCLGCTNCTLVCPTCFCTSVTKQSDLTGEMATTERRWDSCFTLGFAAVAGGNFRSRRQDRYRQWLTHKYGTWLEQFGTSGCVGCGRCITWCPVGIDVREELMAIAMPPGSSEPRQPSGSEASQP